MSYPSTFHSIFARNCRVERINADVARDFLQKHHRYGWSRCKYCYGLFINKMAGGALDCCGNSRFPLGTLIAVACFSNARRWEKDGRTICSYEWVRYASIEGTRVQGGMGKLLDRFIKEIQPDDIMSYAPQINGDEGSVYGLLGFKVEGEKVFENGTSVKYRLKLTDY